MVEIYRRGMRVAARVGIRANVTASFLVSAGIILWAMLAPDKYFVSSASTHVAIFLLALALALPPRIEGLVFVLGLAANVSLQAISNAKAALTSMPLTSLDLAIFFSNPAGFLGAMNWSPTVFFSLAAVIAAVIVCMFVCLTKLHLRQNGRPGLRAVTLSIIACLLMASSVPVFASRLQQTVKPYSKFMPAPWWPPLMVVTSGNLGILPFLVLSSRLGTFNDAILLRKTAASSPTTGAELQPTITKYIKVQPQPKLVPNIVVVLLESTFDINAAFALSPPFKSSLSVKHADAQLSGTMSVNIVGGGTWISEFEAITGIDSRLFGYLGLYTHVAVSPFIKNSLATFLNAIGYKTMSLYPVPGKFYSARTGYHNYGIKHFLDSDNLGISEPWKASDRQLIRKFKAAMKGEPSKPFAAFLLTLENHGPHPCIHFKTGPFPHKLIGEDDRDMNCQINEYILRHKSSAAAIDMLEAHLRDIEEKTGRPYVLALYGDHHPHTFVVTGQTSVIKTFNYDKLRKISKKQTFFQIRSSMKNPFARKTMDIPLMLLPTLISAYVAKSDSDLYLPVNLNLYEQCGRSLPIAGGKSIHAILPGHSSKMSEACANAMEKAIPVYKAAILKL